VRGGVLAHTITEVMMRYLIAWLLGVPFGLIVLWYVIGHTACG
jgi:hypothetical protein